MPEPQPAAVVIDGVDVGGEGVEVAAGELARALGVAGVHRQRAAAALAGGDDHLDAVAREHAAAPPC